MVLPREKSPTKNTAYYNETVPHPFTYLTRLHACIPIILFSSEGKNQQYNIKYITHIPVPTCTRKLLYITLKVG